MLKNKPI